VARFVGGPCDGKTVPATVYPQASCGGTTYIQHEDGNYYTGIGVGGGGPATLDSQQIGKAWHRLMNVYAVEAPAALRKARAARAFIRRTVR
jgi:hypothetical protein